MQTGHVKATATSQVNKMVVRHFYEFVWNQRQLAKIDVTHSPDWSGHYRYTGSTTVRGQSALQRRVAELARAIPDLSFELTEVAAVGDLVMVRFWLSGTEVGTDRPFRTVGLATHRLARGRITEEWVFNQTLARFENRAPVAASTRPASWGPTVHATRRAVLRPARRRTRVAQAA